jgi:hypothetical protein
MLGRAAGSAVRLADAAPALFVCEGIESVMAAMTAEPMPGWAALSTAGLVALALPRIVTDVTIIADHDRSNAGEKAARALGQRCIARGLRVGIVMPREIGTDINDVLLAGEERCDGAA